MIKVSHFLIEKKFKRGQPIVSIDRKVDGVYVILEGEAKISVTITKDYLESAKIPVPKVLPHETEVNLSTISRGDIIGITDVFKKNKRYTINAIC